MWRLFRGDCMRNLCYNRLVPILLVLCLMMSSLTGCGISSQHLEVTYEENTNEEVHTWEDVDDNSITTWDNVAVVSWNDVDDYTDWVYSDILFEDITKEMPIVDCTVLDYKSNGKYFDGDLVYKMVGDKFDVNSFVAKYAVGTGVIVICVVLNVTTGGITTPVTCFIAGAADASVSMAVKGAAFGAATKAVISAIKSGSDFEETFYGALEGSADGYMWGAIYGAATGGFSSKYCFVGETLVETDKGMKPIESISIGDNVNSYNEETGLFSYETVSQIAKGSSIDLVDISTKNSHIISTSSHPFLTQVGWKPAVELTENDYLMDGSNLFIKVDSAKPYTAAIPVEVFSLCVTNGHTYIIGNDRVIVHNRCNPNEKHADSTRLFDKGSDLAQKYPEGVYIKPTGYPDFSPYATKTVSFEPPTKAGVAAAKCLRGDCYYDFKMANKAAFGIDSVTATPKGFTWHHCEDGITMQLIPTDLHRGIGHDGGEKVIALLLGGL